ncbi:MAG: hypothetical protein R2697_00310 [Ilumatobacteraceae bacterium]
MAEIGLLGTALMVTSVLPLVHGLTTPGVLYGDNEAFRTSIYSGAARRRRRRPAADASPLPVRPVGCPPLARLDAVGVARRVHPRRRRRVLPRPRHRARTARPVLRSR